LLLLFAVTVTACGATIDLSALPALAVEDAAPPAGAEITLDTPADASAEIENSNPAVVDNQPAAPPAVAQVDPAQANAAAIAVLEGVMATIYERVNPSVVHIQHAAGEGSGFVWDPAGHIVSNHHVVAGASQLTVTFADGTIVEGIIVGSDPDSDLAVIQVDPTEAALMPVQLADSTQQRVGELVIAIGNPFGQEGTMTVGIISALGRQISVDNSVYRIPDVIQTDAAINPGNSGGVLLNSEGELIGVTSAIISAVRSSSGVGFAIPSAIVQRVVPALITDGAYQNPYLGVTGATVSAELAATRGLPAGQRGAILVSIVPDGPAAAAGLQGGESSGDIVLAVDGNPVQTMDDLITYLARYGTAGEAVTFTLQRGNQSLDIPVTLGARPD
jgi:2-alkenal reductase